MGPGWRLSKAWLMPRPISSAISCRRCWFLRLLPTPSYCKYNTIFAHCGQRICLCCEERYWPTIWTAGLQSVCCPHPLLVRQHDLRSLIYRAARDCLCTGMHRPGSSPAARLCYLPVPESLLGLDTLRYHQLPVSTIQAIAIDMLANAIYCLVLRDQCGDSGPAAVRNNAHASKRPCRL